MISIDNFRLQNETASAAAPSETPNRYQHKCQKHRTTSLISFKTLKNSIKELLALRMRVRRAERANEKYANVGPNTKISNPAGRKQLADKRAR